MGPLTTSSHFWPHCTCFELILKRTQSFYMLNIVEKIKQKHDWNLCDFNMGASVK